MAYTRLSKNFRSIRDRITAATAVQLRSAGAARSEDLTRLTYPDNSFDLILTSETLEHVPDLNAALCEIHRVLCPEDGICSPFLSCPERSKHTPVAIVQPDGSIHDRSPRICHPGGDWGYPVFTELGTDLECCSPGRGSRPKFTSGQSAKMICRKCTFAGNRRGEVSRFGLELARLVDPQRCIQPRGVALIEPVNVDRVTDPVEDREPPKITVGSECWNVPLVNRGLRWGLIECDRIVISPREPVQQTDADRVIARL